MRALVIGVDGAIGAALAPALAADGWRVAGTSRRGRPGALPLDLMDVPDAVSLPAADAVFLCAAMTRQADCRDDPVRAARVNRDAPLRLAEAVAGRAGRLVFLSSSAVFDGRAPRRGAADPPCPLNDYGRMKAEAEAAVLATPGGTVVRLTKVLHGGLPLLRGWCEALRRGERIRAFADLAMAPVALEDAASALVRIGRAAVTAGEAGVFQISATKDITYLDAARHIARRLGLPPDRAEAASAAAAGIPLIDRPAATSLDSSRYARLFNAPPPDPFDVIDRVLGLNGRENG